MQIISNEEKRTYSSDLNIVHNFALRECSSATVMSDARRLPLGRALRYRYFRVTLLRLVQYSRHNLHHRVHHALVIIRVAFDG